MLVADLTIKEVPAPPDRWCNGAMGGHSLTEDVQFEGKPVRFFKVASDEHSGVYCELCLTVANAMARKKRGTR